jgi:hypothetical protein
MSDAREQLVMQLGADIHRLKVALGDVVSSATTLEEAKEIAARALGEPTLQEDPQP